MDMTEKEMIRNQLLDTLIDFDKICRDEKIQYSLHGGTLLGAVRNGKFIPWDDDIDISMTRKNFIHLARICKQKKGLHIMYSKIAPWIPRVYSSNPSAPIDILIYDYICENKIGQLIKISLLSVLQCFLKQNVQPKYDKFWKSMVVNILRKIGSCFSEKKIKKVYTFIAQNCFVGKKKKIHRSVDQFSALSIILPKEVMEEYMTMPFEKKYFLVTKNYDCILSTAYGKDYLIPPSPEKRKTDHSDIRKNCLK